jgi:hypothetical protein
LRDVFDDRHAEGKNPFSPKLMVQISDRSPSCTTAMSGWAGVVCAKQPAPIVRILGSEERATSFETIRQIPPPLHVHRHPPETVANRVRLGASTLMP